MDPVTLSVVLIASVGAGIFFVKTVFPFIAHSQIENSIEKERQRELSSQTLTAEQKRLKMEGKDYQIKNTNGLIGVNFKSINNNNDVLRVNLEEMRVFDPKQDRLLRGVLTTTDNKGEKHQEDIYLFQPRLLAENDVCVGPKFYSNGTLADQYCYLIKNPKNGEVMYSNISKREALSGVVVDIVIDSMQKQTKYGDFLKIEIPRDENGNFMVVDFNDQNEVARYQEYCKNFTTVESAANSLRSKISTSKKAYDDYQEYMLYVKKLQSLYQEQSNQDANNYNQEVEERRRKEQEAIERSLKSYDRYNFYRPPIFGVPGTPTAHATNIVHNAPADHHHHHHH